MEGVIAWSLIADEVGDRQSKTALDDSNWTYWQPARSLEVLEGRSCWRPVSVPAVNIRLKMESKGRNVRSGLCLFTWELVTLMLAGCGNQKPSPADCHERSEWPDYTVASWTRGLGDPVDTRPVQVGVQGGATTVTYEWAAICPNPTPLCTSARVEFYSKDKCSDWPVAAAPGAS